MLFDAQFLKLKDSKILCPKGDYQTLVKIFSSDATPIPYGPLKIVKKGMFLGTLNKSWEFGGNA